MLRQAQNALARGILNQNYVDWNRKAFENHITPQLNAWRVTDREALIFLLQNCESVKQIPETRTEWKDKHDDYFKLVANWPLVGCELFIEMRLIVYADDDAVVLIVNLHEQLR